MAKKISKKKVASPKKKEVKKKPEVIVATNSTVQFVPHATGHILEWWRGVAKQEKADIVLIHVIDDSPHLPFFSKKEDKEVENKILSELEKLAHETTNAKGVKVKTEKDW